jgi:hypothetical protein
MPYPLLEMSRIAFLVFCLCSALVAGAAAQDNNAGPSGKGITAAAILEKNLTATGGREAHERLQSMVLRGDIGYSGLGWFTFSYRAPSDDVLKVQARQFGTFWRGRHEGRSFSRGTVERPDRIKMEQLGVMPGGEQSFAGDPLSIRVMEQDLRSLLDWDFEHNYEKVELIGRAEVNKRWALGVRFVPHEGDPVIRFYDSETFLLVRMDQVERFRRTKDGPENARIVQSYFTDYKESGGLKLPCAVRISRPQVEFELKIAKFEPNVKIEDSVFQ